MVVFLNLMIINVNKLIENIYRIKKKTNKEIIAVIKSNAYNTGVRPIIKYLKLANVSFFAFNTLEEYQYCQDLLINDKVLIFESLKEKQINLLPKNVRITINNIDDIYEIQHPRIVHIQIDTMMNRMGIKNINDFKKIINYENINIEGIYTHFISNKIEYKKYRLQQQKFKEYISLYNTPIIHSAASSSLGKEIIGNYVRVGMDLYNDAVNVYTKLGSIRYIKKGEYVGYDALYKAKKDGYIGILNIGYNEGMKTGVVKYRDKYYPVIGKICMNHTFIKLDKPIKNSSLLNIFPINDKIYKKDKYTIYERIVSYRNFKRIYITEYNYDLRKISKISLKKSYIIKQRTRSNKTSNA